jgi:DNA-binding GntR family transcriptional regulator
VSRLTLRRAIQELVDNGLLVRKRGVGTQVVNDQLPRPARLGSLYDDLIERGRTPSTTVLAHERVIADDVIADQLSLPPGSPVVYLERCRYADGKRLAILRNWLTVAAAADITTDDLMATGLYCLLRDRGIWPHSSWRRLAARNAGPVDAALLGLAVGAPVLVMESTMQDKSGTRIEVSEQLHDGASYTMELSVVES